VSTLCLWQAGDRISKHRAPSHLLNTHRKKGHGLNKVVPRVSRSPHSLLPSDPIFQKLHDPIARPSLILPYSSLSSLFRLALTGLHLSSFRFCTKRSLGPAVDRPENSCSFSGRPHFAFIDLYLLVMCRFDDHLSQQTH
jgi:hypothetical protein